MPLGRWSPALGGDSQLGLDSSGHSFGTAFQNLNRDCSSCSEFEAAVCRNGDFCEEEVPKSGVGGGFW
jgi:hypothetical protein